jgi:hypothetical protein
MTIEEAISELARQGRIHHLSLSASSAGFQASFREKSGAGYKVEVKPDPIEAILGALGPHFGQTWDDHLNRDEDMDLV